MIVFWQYFCSEIFDQHFFFFGNCKKKVQVSFFFIFGFLWKSMFQSLYSIHQNLLSIVCAKRAQQMTQHVILSNNKKVITSYAQLT